MKAVISVKSVSTQQVAVAAPAVRIRQKRRLMDPIHGLITFDVGDVDQVAWELINTAEFQRLRRIKQLGFSEYVFPGATHSRFAHSIGVFHNARRLVRVVEQQTGTKPDEGRVFQTCIAALLHDVGHGPYSHSFEKVQKEISESHAKKHEDWSAEIIGQHGGSIARILGSNIAADIAKRLKKKDPSDIFDSIVASQFDGDRLDYLVRDRYMTGVQLGGFDIDWLFDSIRVGRITVGYEGKDDDAYEVDALYLSDKGIRAAEGYLIARFHMYEQVYLHKSTRCMEIMFQKLLREVANDIKNSGQTCAIFPETSPLGKFLRGKLLGVSDYLSLDDSSLSEAVGRLAGVNGGIGMLAQRLLTRNLYKCFDIGRMNQSQDGHSIMKFKRGLLELKKTSPHLKLLEDKTVLSPYKLHGYDEPGALQKVLIGSDKGGDSSPKDVKNKSSIIASLSEVDIFRVYVESTETKEKLADIWRDVQNG
jgi:uncharacterized protein